MLAGMRFLIAGLILFGISRLRGAPMPSRLEWRNAALLGFILLVCGSGAVAVAEGLGVASGLASIGFASVPVWSAIFVALLFRQTSRLEWLGVALGFAGVVLLNLGGDLRGQPLGAAVLIFSAVSWAFGAVISPRFKLAGGSMTSATQMICAGVIELLLSAFVVREHIRLPITAGAVLGELYLIFFGSLLAFSAFTYLVHHVRPALATSYTYINPIVAVGLGVLVVGERITSTDVIAMLVILSGVAVIAMARSNFAARLSPASASAPVAATHNDQP
jgi:drug/metabolite transporter (DMT)-like permease